MRDEADDDATWYEDDSRLLLLAALLFSVPVLPVWFGRMDVARRTL